MEMLGNLRKQPSKPTVLLQWANASAIGSMDYNTGQKYIVVAACAFNGSLWMVEGALALMTTVITHAFESIGGKAEQIKQGFPGVSS